MIRTLVCASSELARIGLAAVVRGDARLLLAGEAAPHELERRVAELDPDVVLEQCDRSGAARRTGTVALVDDPRGAWTNESRASEDPGAHAILARDAAPDEIAAAIVAVAAGLVAVQPRTLAAATAAVAAASAGPAGATAAGFASGSLTARERDVLGELARGAPNRTIAARLSISEHTVKFHIASIFTKLGVSSRTEAVTQGVRRGLVML